MLSNWPHTVLQCWKCWGQQFFRRLGNRWPQTYPHSPQTSPCPRAILHWKTWRLPETEIAAHELKKINSAEEHLIIHIFSSVWNQESRGIWIHLQRQSVSWRAPEKSRKRGLLDTLHSWSPNSSPSHCTLTFVWNLLCSIYANVGSKDKEKLNKNKRGLRHLQCCVKTQAAHKMASAFSLYGRREAGILSDTAYWKGTRGKPR